MTVKDEDILQKEALKPSVKSSEHFSLDFLAT